MRAGWLLRIGLLVTACATPKAPADVGANGGEADAAASDTAPIDADAAVCDAGPTGLEAFLRQSSAADPAFPVQPTQLQFRRAGATGAMKYGSFLITEHDATPWQSGASVESTGACPTSQPPDLTLRTAAVKADDGSALATLDIADRKDAGAGARIVTRTLTATPLDATLNRAAIAWPCKKGEHFIGLGGQSWDVDHRGQTVPLWVSEDGITKLDNDGDNPGWFFSGSRHSTHSPMPIFLSSAGYAVLLETPARAIFQLCSDASDTVRLENWQGSLKLHVFAGKDVADTLRLLTQKLGRPAVPPLFAFAPWLDAIYGSANVRRVAQKLRQAHIPVGAIWSEDWRGGAKSNDEYTLDEDWNSDEKLYPDIQALAADLHAWGFKFLTYNNTFLTQDADVYAQATGNGYSIRKADGTPYTYDTAKFVPGSMLDLSNPEAVKWAQGVYQKGIDQGADGWMADFCEWLPVDIQLFSKEDPWLVHNRYAVDCQKLNKDLMDKQKDGVERLFFVRSAWLGSQPLVSVFWPGDQQTDFSPGDGLPSVIPMAIGLGVSGFPYFGSDIGGYMSTLAESPTTKELWFRWVELGAFSAVMRTHHGKSAQSNWNWESDAESTEHMRNYATMHMKLLPYLQAAAKQAAATGLPLMRPLALNWPAFEPGWSLTDEFALGDQMVVAPVVVMGATSRDVRLPPGRWYPLRGGPVVTATASAPLQISAPLAEIPVFVPAGTMLVLLPDGVDTPLDVTAGSALHDLGFAANHRELWLWPGPQPPDAAGTQFVDTLGKEPLTFVWQPAAWNGELTALQWAGKAVQPVDGRVELTVDGDGTLQIGVAKLSVQAPKGSKLTVRFPSAAK